MLPRSSVRIPRIQSLVRANAILQAIASAPGGAARLVDIQRATGLRKTTVHTLLETLAALGFGAGDAPVATRDAKLRAPASRRERRNRQAARMIASAAWTTPAPAAMPQNSCGRFRNFIVFAAMRPQHGPLVPMIFAFLAGAK